MKMALQITSWLLAILGVCAILASLFQWDTAQFFCGLFFAAQGAMAIVYIRQTSKLHVTKTQAA